MEIDKNSKMLLDLLTKCAGELNTSQETNQHIKEVNLDINIVK